MVREDAPIFLQKYVDDFLLELRKVMRIQFLISRKEIVDDILRHIELESLEEE